MDNNNYGNKPSFGSTPFNGEGANRMTPRSSFSNSSYRPMSSVGSGYPRSSSFASSYRRPMGGMGASGFNRPAYGSMGASGRPAYGSMGSSGFNRPYGSSYGGMGSYGSFNRPAYGSLSSTRSIGYSGMGGVSGFNRPHYGASPYASRFAPVDSSRYGYGRTLPQLSIPNQEGQNASQEPVFNKYSLDNAQPQGVDVHNNFQEVAPQYQEPTQQYQEPTQQYQEPTQQYQEPTQQYQEPVAQEEVQYEQPVSSGEELSAEFLKNWEPSIMSLAEYSSVGLDQRGAYIIDDAGNLIGEGFEGKQEDPNNPDAELFEYAAEINAVNNAYSLGRDAELYQANILSSDIPSEESASYIAQMGIKAIYYWVKGEKEFKKYHKNKDYKKVLAILEPLNCKLIPVQGEK
ncbi:MAG: hypothetical protein ACRC8C_01290 [Mycoplasmoidaceae bacterium]